MHTFNFKVLLNSNSYGLIVSALNWPSTGSTSNMIIACADLLRWMLREEIVKVIFILFTAFACIATVIIVRPAFLSLEFRYWYLGLTTLLVWSILLSACEVLATWCAVALPIQLLLTQCVTSAALIFFGSQITSYIDMNKITINQYGK